MEAELLRQPGQYGDILRVIGRLLDEREALEAEAIHLADQDGIVAKDARLVRDTEIIEHEAFMTVYWTSGESLREQSFTEPIISDLCAEAHRLRGKPAQHPTGERSELLRTLGDELDAEGINFNGIIERDQAFVVSGIADRRYVNQRYEHEDLRALSQQRQPRRSPLPPPDDPVSTTRQESRLSFLRRRVRL